LGQGVLRSDEYAIEWFLKGDPTHDAFQLEPVLPASRSNNNTSDGPQTLVMVSTL
jgi:hypothetical protein